MNDDRIEDLDVPERDIDDVKGGGLNTYLSPVKGEKQGAASVWDGQTKQTRQVTLVQDL